MTTSAERREEHDDLLAEMRARVEDAARQLDAVTAELAERRAHVDDLETLVDVLLGLTPVPVLVLDPADRIAALSRGAAERYAGVSVGAPSPGLGAEAAEYELPGGGRIVVQTDGTAADGLPGTV
jgi:hypothetical protein